MYIFKNAIKNLGRNKGRNILMGILIFLMLLVVCISVVIGSASQKISEVYKNRFQVTANLKVDYMSLIGGSTDGLLDIPSPSQEDYERFSDSDYVEDCITFGSTVVYAPEVTAIGEDKIIADTPGMQIMEPDGFSAQFYSANLSLYGYSDLMLLTDFIEGNRKFISGSVFTEINECVISSELAEQNGLSVGDTIEARTAKKATSQTLNLTISGIYLDAIPNDTAIRNVTQNRRNDIMVGFETLMQLSGDKYNIDGTFILSNPNAVDAFTAELYEKGLADAYYISSNVADYQQVAAPAEGISNIVRVFMAVVLVLGGSILLFLSLITIRERKYEIGILRAKGMSKIKIAILFFTENFAIILTCVIFAMSIGILVAQPVSDMLLHQQIEELDKQQDSQNDYYQGLFVADNSPNKTFGSNAQDLEPITRIPVELTKNNILSISFFSIALCILTSLAGVIYISKNEPMKILMERG